MTEQCTMTDEQVENLRGDLEFITAHRGRHDQTVWWDGGTLAPISTAFDETGAPACGSSGCLAGWAVARQYADVTSADGSFIAFADPEDEDGLEDPDGEEVYLGDTSAVRVNHRHEVLEVLGNVQRLAAERYGIDQYHRDGARGRLFDGHRTLRQQWEAAHELSGGRITVPDDLPADADTNPYHESEM